MRCSYCGAYTHTIVLCPKTWSGSVNRIHLRCTYCGGRDHDIQACPKTWDGNAARTWRKDTIADHFHEDGPC